MMYISKIISRRSLTRFYSSAVNAINWDYYSDVSNFKEIASNIIARNVSCEMNKTLLLLDELSKCKNDLQKSQYLKKELSSLLYWFPNQTHPIVIQNKSPEPIVLEKIGKKPTFEYFPSTFSNLTKRLNCLRTKFLGHICGNKGYYLKHDLAALEHALVQYALSKLLKKGFQMVTVPDILNKDCLEGCGMKTDTNHSMVYCIDRTWKPNLCLSGTSEIALASVLSSKTFKSSELPKRFCAASRCYRAEANRHQKERGIFRVHHFTKVEMFGVTANSTSEESEDLLKEFTSIQKEIFSDLGLHCKVLEMPPSDLGLPAYHKIDIEAWIPSQKIYGEISSASNCTDYQSRRLDVKYENLHSTKFCHTVNGTACAIPRLLISIFENFQNLDGSIDIPHPIQRFMKKECIKDKFDEIMLSTKPVA